MSNTEPMTAAEAARHHGIPKRTILAAVERGEIRSRKLEGRTGAHLLNRQDVAKFARTWANRPNRLGSADAAPAAV